MAINNIFKQTYAIITLKNTYGNNPINHKSKD